MPRGQSGVASEFAAGPLFWFQQLRVRAPPGTRGQSCSPALTREPRLPPSRVPGRSPGQGRRSGVPFPWCRRMTLCDLGPGLDVLVSGSRASLWVEILPASQQGAWGEVQRALSAPQDAASGHCHTVVTVHFLRPESDTLSRGIQRAWRSASPGPSGSHCSRPEHSCGSRAVFGSWPEGGQRSAQSTVPEQRLTQSRFLGRESDASHSHAEGDLYLLGKFQEEASVR